MAEEKASIQAVPKIERASNKPVRQRGILTVDKDKLLLLHKISDSPVFLPGVFCFKTSTIV